MGCFKVHQLFEHKRYSLKINTPEDLDNIKLLLLSLASRYVASRYEQAPEHVFQPLSVGNKNVFFVVAPSTRNKHLKHKSFNLTVDPAQKIITF